MVIDTSALIAILLAEPEADDMVGAIAAASRRWLPAPAFVEKPLVWSAVSAGAAMGT